MQMIQNLNLIPVKTNIRPVQSDTNRSHRSRRCSIQQFSFSRNSLHLPLSRFHFLFRRGDSRGSRLTIPRRRGGELSESFPLPRVDIPVTLPARLCAWHT